MSHKIMIVDDALFMRKTIRKILEGSGYTDIVEEADGESAVKAYDVEKPDLMLLDITMPGISGLEVLEDIIKRDPKAKIIMCSAVGQEMMIQKAILMGASDFIVKPFKKDEFQKIVMKSLEG
ncbi:MAG: response regulator [Eubacteriales bacterium]|nr:response regulator [Eubacteriales bacterium]